MQLSKQWTAAGYWVGGLWFWYSFWGNTHRHWVGAAPSRWTWIYYFVSSRSALRIYIPAYRTWICDPCEGISPHSMFTWHEAHLILEPTVEENKKYWVHRDHLISKLCSFHDAMLPPKNCERSPLVMLANDSPSVGATSQLLRGILQTPNMGQGQSSFSKEAFPLPQPFSTSAFAHWLLWKVVCNTVVRTSSCRLDTCPSR